MKVCPYCAEEIQDAAIKCRYCGTDLTSAPPQPSPRENHSVAIPLRRPAPEEKVYYSDGAITVTSTRAVLGAKTYAMANITSVSLAEHNEGSGCGCSLLAVGGFFALFLASADAAAVGFLGIVLLIIGAFVLAQNSYVVRIGSASGETNALQHKSREHIQTIVDAVNQAIIDRR